MFIKKDNIISNYSPCWYRSLRINHNVIRLENLVWLNVDLFTIQTVSRQLYLDY